MIYVVTFLCIVLMINVLLLVYMVGKVRVDAEIIREILIAFIVEYENTHPDSGLWKRLQEEWKVTDGRTAD